MLILVRHAMPAVDPDVPPERWHLSPDGHRAATALAARLPADAVLVASAEPKARQTLGGGVSIDNRFNEVVRDEPYDGDYRARRRAYVSGTDHPGWEPRDQVVARFAEGVTGWLGRSGPRLLVVATHGMAMTLWLAAGTPGLADPGAFWADLRLPDAFAVDPDTRTAERIG